MSGKINGHHFFNNYQKSKILSDVRYLCRLGNYLLNNQASRHFLSLGSKFFTLKSYH